jgi:hypothetical protein
VGWVGVVVESRSPLTQLQSNILTGGLRPEMAKTDGSSSSLPKPTPFTVYVGSSSSSLPK